MKSVINWLSKMFESMANAFMHPLKNDLPPSIGTHSYSSIPIKRKFLNKKEVTIKAKVLNINNDLKLNSLIFPIIF